MPEPQQVRAMFGRIAPTYDLLNNALSLGIDRSWRRRLLRRAGDVRGRTVVDSCCGTGDVALVFERAGARVVGLDFTPEMLVRAESKRHAGHAARTLFTQGDALRLPIQTASADVCTVAFGIRNVADRRAALREMARVLRPGGTLLVLECSMPENRLLGALYRHYFLHVLPAIGALVSRDREAYSYLPRTVQAWPLPEQFLAELEAEGLDGCGFERLSGGIACLHWGQVPRGAGQ